MKVARIAAMVGLVLLASAGLAGAMYAGQSVWGDANPGQGSAHAAMAQAGADHNQAGAIHPPSDAGMPEELPEQADDHAQDNYPPETGGGSQDGGAPDELPDQANDHADEHYPKA